MEKLQASSIFEFTSYVDYLKARSGPKARSGFWSALAEACGVNSAFISQVTARQKDLALEQAERATRFLGLTTLEAEFFLLLVQRERAGTPELRSYFLRKLEETQFKARSNLKNRLSGFKEFTPTQQAIYYGHWGYTAIHIALTVPTLRTPQALMAKLGLERDFVAEVLEFLVENGLATFDGSEYRPTSKLVHLDRRSKHIHRHHLNWRVRSLLALDEMRDENLHYSVVVSLSEADYRRYREKLLEFTKQFMADIKDSPEETLAGFTFDFFKAAGRG